MKRKYKIEILITLGVVSLIWELLGSWLYIHYLEDNTIGLILLYLVYLVTLAVPVKIIANRARKDVAEHH